MIAMLDPTTSDEREVAERLRGHVPEIAPSYGWGGDPCWLAWALTQSAEHNPPFYWLGRAFDIADAEGAGDLFGERLRIAHGTQSCEGRGEADERAQDVLTEVCAYAWATVSLGDVTVEPASEGAEVTSGPVRLHVPNAGTWVAPRRLRPQRTLEQVMYQVGALAEDAARSLPTTPSDDTHGVLYVDVWHERRYAQSVGYRLELTEPVQAAVRHFALEHGLGYVLTRPFEWGRALEEWF
jgi:hypothetical protein